MNDQANVPTTQPGTQKQMSQQKAEELLMSPNADILARGEGVTLYMDLPGVSRDHLSIEVESNVLTVRGGVNLYTPEDLRPTYMDVHSGVFLRQFTLSDELDSESVDAVLNNGELRLYIPRREQHKPRKIEIKAA